MRLVESSDPTAVPKAEALLLIRERLVLANAVCAELEVCQGQYAHSVPAAALSLLRRWVGARYEADVETHASDGLELMVVPDEGVDLMDDLRVATVVCEDLAMLWTADTRSEFRQDSERLTESLGYWQARRFGDRTPLNVPVADHSPISLPSQGSRLSPYELAYKKKSTSQGQAERWNEMLADHPGYGPASGFVVGVADQSQEGTWPLIWVRTS